MSLPLLALGGLVVACFTAGLIIWQIMPPSTRQLYYAGGIKTYWKFMLTFPKRS